MKFNILTLFPEVFTYLDASMLGRAKDAGIIEFSLINIRDYTHDIHNRVDDTPFGGGSGMVMEAEPIIEAYNANALSGPVIYMSPRGQVLDYEIAKELSECDSITILSGHYEGVDERALAYLGAREISIGDYIMTGGELPAMVLIDVVSRLIPGVLASAESAFDESIYSGLLEAPHYTKPRECYNMTVPEVLVSGNHKQIDLWRLREALKLTKERRPDLFKKFLEREHDLDKQERKILEEFLD